MSSILRVRMLVSFAGAGILVACTGGSGGAPTLDPNPQDPPGSSFERGASGERPASIESAPSCFPCETRFDCEVTARSGRVETVRGVRLCSASERPDVDDDDGQIEPDPSPNVGTRPATFGPAVSLRQNDDDVGLRILCGGQIVDRNSNPAGSWSISPTGAVSACVTSQGCLSCVPSSGAVSAPRPVDDDDDDDERPPTQAPVPIPEVPVSSPT